jgi:hypothetical protein
MTCCPYFRGTPWACCHAVEGDKVVPTLHERERYCLGNGDHHRCPTLAAAQARGGRLSERDYFMLWMMPAAPPPAGGLPSDPAAD